MREAAEANAGCCCSSKTARALRSRHSDRIARQRWMCGSFKACGLSCYAAVYPSGQYGRMWRFTRSGDCPCHREAPTISQDVWKQALVMGTAAAASNAMQELAGHIDIDQVRQFADRVKVSEVEIDE